MIFMNKELIINTYEENTLLFKENLLGIFKNNILQYENETDAFKINVANQTLEKENLESLLKISPHEALITLKEINQSFELKIQKYNFSCEKNKITLEYLLESHEQPLKIEIEMSDINA